MEQYEDIEIFCNQNRDLIDPYLGFESGNTVYGEARSAQGTLVELEEQINEIELGMMYHKGSALADLKDVYDRLYRKFEAAGGYGYEERIEEFLAWAGFGERDFIRPIGELSEQQKLHLAAVKYLLTLPETTKKEED